ncbi:MAG: hypothetical protein AAF677_05615 [Pseudomonadota bacterium]
MKLTDRQLGVVKDLLGLDPIPQTHPQYAALIDTHGDHTFFINRHGLMVFVEQDGDRGGRAPQLTYIAAWTDEARTALARVEPVEVGVEMRDPD